MASEDPDEPDSPDFRGEEEEEEKTKEIKSPIDFDTSEFFARVDAEEYVQLEKQYAVQKKAAQDRVNDKLFEALK